MKRPGRITTVGPKKHEQDLRVAEWNHQNRDKLKAKKSKSKLNLSQYYCVGAVMSVRILGIFGYYIYRCKKGDATPVH